jgi:hypothetical protein
MSLPLPLPVADRPACEFPHFKGANDAAEIMGVQTDGRGGIDAGQSVVEDMTADPLGFGGQPLAEVVVRRWAIEQAMEQGFEVQRRPADEKHLPPAPLNVPATGRRLLQPPGDAGRLPGIEHVQQMVRHALSFVGTGLGRANVHAPVEGHGIHRDDFRAQLLSQSNAEPRLAGAGWAGQDQGTAEDVRNHTRL